MYGQVEVAKSLSPQDEAKYQTRWAMEKYGRFVKAMTENHLSIDEVEQLVEFHHEITGVVAKKLSATLKKAKVRK